MSKYQFERYETSLKNKWDDFILNRSINGTFLQTRTFIEYHAPDKFLDHSLIYKKGNEIVACILACEIRDEEGLKFYSHKGTTYGGFVISDSIYSTKNIYEMITDFEDYLTNNGFSFVSLKMTPQLYSRADTKLLDYFFYKEGYSQISELNFYIPLDPIRGKNQIVDAFSSSKRRDYRYSEKSNFKFVPLEGDDEIRDFHTLLKNNLEKFDAKCVHTHEELLDLKNNRFPEQIKFYGVFCENILVAGTMLFFFNNIVHTQYLCSDRGYLHLFPMDFLIYNIIDLALKSGAESLSFGICTENRGKEINLGLAHFKEGYGTKYDINKTFEKVLR